MPATNIPSARRIANIAVNDAMILPYDAIQAGWNFRKGQVELALKSKLPAVYPEAEFATAGGLASYGPSLPELFRRAANYVDKILKGAKPADLPIEQPAKFELVVNLKTAKSLGLPISRDFQLRADQLIE